MRQILIALLALLALAGCTATVEPPLAKVVVVPASAPSPGFCPPGQAKKGNC